MLLKNEIIQIMSVRVLSFDGLPDVIIQSLREMLKIHTSDTLLKEMKELLEPFKKDEFEHRKYMGNSGAAAEFHMAAAIKLQYLRQSIEFIYREKYF
ncbi:hypothetical protein [Photobacterium sp. R1]